MKSSMSNAKPFYPSKMDFPSLGDSDTNSTEENSPIISCESHSPKTKNNSEQNQPEISVFQPESDGPSEESLRTENRR